MTSDAAEVEKQWNSILDRRSAKASAPTIIEDEFCREDTCIEPANESGFCAAHQPTDE